MTRNSVSTSRTSRELVGSSMMTTRASMETARASATILGALPFVMFGLLMLVNPGYMSLLVTDPRGHLMIGFGLFWGFIGILMMARMVRFEI